MTLPALETLHFEPAFTNRSFIVHEVDEAPSITVRITRAAVSTHFALDPGLLMPLLTTKSPPPGMLPEGGLSR